MHDALLVYLEREKKKNLLRSLSSLKISIVKDMTTLSGVKDTHWTYFCEMTIREFFLNPNFTTMCIFFSHNRLIVTLSFPLILVNEFTYFIREPREVLRAETFRNDILFGTVNDKPEYYVLSMVENVLAPIFLKVETWPDSILLNSRLINQTFPSKRSASLIGCIFLQRISPMHHSYPVSISFKHEIPFIILLPIRSIYIQLDR